MNTKGQHLSEYALIISVVALAVTAMQPFFKRSIQGVVKMTDDEVGKIASQEYDDWLVFQRRPAVRRDAQLIGQGIENVYDYTTDNMKNDASQDTNMRYDAIGSALKINKDDSSFTAKSKLKYRYYTASDNTDPGNTESGRSGFATEAPSSSTDTAGGTQTP